MDLVPSIAINYLKTRSDPDGGKVVYVVLSLPNILNGAYNGGVSLYYCFSKKNSALINKSIRSWIITYEKSDLDSKVLSNGLTI